MTAGSYAERDAQRVIPMKSDDGGLTWYPLGGDPTKAIPFDTPTVIHLKSADAGATWTTT